MRDGCIFCVTFPALAFSYLFTGKILSNADADADADDRRRGTAIAPPTLSTVS